MSWEKIIKEDSRGKRRYQEFLSSQYPQDDALTTWLGLKYAEEMLAEIEDDERYDDAMKALEMIKEVHKAIGLIEDVGKELQNMLPKLID